MATKPTQNNAASNEAGKAEPERSEKFLLGEKMVVEFLGKPYQLGVSVCPRIY